MKRFVMCLLLLAMFMLSGCYVATIDTGRAKSSKTISKPWAACWIYGLVAPPPVLTATECPDGVAMVKTQHSFLNYVVGALTFGIYTPIQIDVTCAEGTKMGTLDPGQQIVVPEGASFDDITDAFGRAADLAVKTGKPVFVHLEH